MRTDLCELAHGPNRDGLCEWDGRPLSGRRRRWCSEACSRAWSRNHFWTAARAYAVEIAGARCDVCGDDEDLEVHHVEPVDPARGYAAGCAHHQDNLAVLCPLHHLDAHAVLRAAPGAAVQMRLVA